MSVVLPAPFGPSRPKTIPSGTSRSTPASAVVDPNRLTTPPTWTAGDRPRRDPLPSGCDNEVALSGSFCTSHYLLADGPDYRGTVARLDRQARHQGCTCEP